MKKLIIFLLTLGLLTGSCAVTAGAETTCLPSPLPTYHAGIALQALQRGVQKQLYFSPQEVFVMDENGDGTINAVDALSILKIAVGKATPTPVTQTDIQGTVEGLVKYDDQYIRKYGYSRTVVADILNTDSSCYRYFTDYDTFIADPNWDEQFFEDHTLVVMVMINAGAETLVPQNAYVKGERLLIEATREPAADVAENDRLVIVTLPKLQNVTAAQISITNCPVLSQPTATSFQNLYDFNHSYSFGGPFEVTTITNSDAFASVAASLDIKDEEYYWENKAVPSMERWMHPEFYQNHVTVAFCYQTMTLMTYSIIDVSPDGIILVMPTGKGSGLPSGALQTQWVLVDIPITENMPKTFTVKII